LNFQKLTGERQATIQRKITHTTPSVHPFLSCVHVNELEPVAGSNFKYIKSAYQVYAASNKIQKRDCRILPLFLHTDFELGFNSLDK